jgi:hypothetical protein
MMDQLANRLVASLPHQSATSWICPTLALKLREYAEMHGALVSYAIRPFASLNLRATVFALRPPEGRCEKMIKYMPRRLEVSHCPAFTIAIPGSDVTSSVRNMRGLRYTRQTGRPYFSSHRSRLIWCSCGVYMPAYFHSAVQQD